MPPTERIAHVAPLVFDGGRFVPGGAVVLTEGTGILAVTPGPVPEGFAVRQHVGGTLSSTAPARRTGLVPAHRFVQVEYLHRQGVRVISGSDGGIHSAKPHGIVAHAVAELVAAGIATDDAIATATSVSAQACGLGTSKGQLKPGADADLLVVEDDPRIDIAALTRVRAVFRGGAELSPN